MVYDSVKQRMFVFTRDGWRPLLFGFDSSSFQDPQKPSVPGLIGDGYLGHVTSIFGDFAVAGVPYDIVNGKSQQGSVIVFKRDGNLWNYFAKITAPDGNAGDWFGLSVVILHNSIFIGAPKSSSLENINEGSVYVFNITDGIIQFQQKITGLSASSGDRFGSSICVNNTDLVIGAPLDDIGINSDQGSIYIFNQNPFNVWIQNQKLFLNNGQANDLFGFGLSIDSNMLSVGNDISIASGNFGYSQNAVNIFEKVNQGWVHKALINQPDGLDKMEGFGFSTNIYRDVLVVGAWLHDTPTNNINRGAAYVFKRDNLGVWNFMQKISPQDLSSGNPGNFYGDYYGYSISRDKNSLLINAHFDDLSTSLNDRGAVYYYEWIGTGFLFKNKFISPNSQAFENFGSSSAILDDTIMIGASGRDGNKGAVFFLIKE
jgi:hypothetical protein